MEAAEGESIVPTVVARGVGACIEEQVVRVGGLRPSRASPHRRGAADIVQLGDIRIVVAAPHTPQRRKGDVMVRRCGMGGLGQGIGTVIIAVIG